MPLMQKEKKLKLKNQYTPDTLYDAIQDKHFTAGKPLLVGNRIVFPALNARNQVWIVLLNPLGAITGNASKKVGVWQRNEASTSNVAKQTLANAATLGVSRIADVAGKTAKECAKLVVTTAKELEELDL